MNGTMPRRGPWGAVLGTAAKAGRVQAARYTGGCIRICPPSDPRMATRADVEEARAKLGMEEGRGNTVAKDRGAARGPGRDRDRGRGLGRPVPKAQGNSGDAGVDEVVGG